MSGPEFSALPSEEKRRLSDADAVIEAAELAEEKRRSNAYPKLVEALRLAAAPHQTGITGKTARALLRELGEAS